MSVKEVDRRAGKSIASVGCLTVYVSCGIVDDTVIWYCVSLNSWRKKIYFDGWPFAGHPVKQHKGYFCHDEEPKMTETDGLT